MKVFRKTENWIYSAWRPAIAWSYLVICMFDFLIAPIIHSVYFAAFFPGQEFVPWKPNTLAEGGLYHMAMMAIVGVTAWTRGQEKLSMINMFGESIEVEKETHTVEPTEESLSKKPTRRRRRR